MNEFIIITIIGLLTFFIGPLVSFQITHIYYCKKKLTKLARRLVNTGTIKPILVDLEEHTAGN
jgi:hypothetical protein